MKIIIILTIVNFLIWGLITISLKTSQIVTVKEENNEKEKKEKD